MRLYSAVRNASAPDGGGDGGGGDPPPIGGVTVLVPPPPPLAQPKEQSAMATTKIVFLQLISDLSTLGPCRRPAASAPLGNQLKTVALRASMRFARHPQYSRTLNLRSPRKGSWLCRNADPRNIDSYGVAISQRRLASAISPIRMLQFRLLRRGFHTARVNFRPCPEVRRATGMWR